MLQLLCIYVGLPQSLNTVPLKEPEELGELGDLGHAVCQSRMQETQTQVYDGDVQPVTALLSEQSVRVDAGRGTACWACRRCCFKQVLCVMLTPPLTRPVNVLTRFTLERAPRKCNEDRSRVSGAGEQFGQSKILHVHLPMHITCYSLATTTAVLSALSSGALHLLSRSSFERAVTEAV